MKILIMELSKDGSLHSDILCTAVCSLIERGHTVLGGRIRNFSEIISLCKTTDYAIFDFSLSDNDSAGSMWRDLQLVTLTRTLFDFKKPTLIIKKSGGGHLLPIVVSILHSEEVKDTIFEYSTAEELLSKVTRRFSLHVQT